MNPTYLIGEQTNVPHPEPQRPGDFSIVTESLKRIVEQAHTLHERVLKVTFSFRREQAEKPPLEDISVAMYAPLPAQLMVHVQELHYTLEAIERTIMEIEL